jgi:hypothetical protein
VVGGTPPVVGGASGVVGGSPGLVGFTPGVLVPPTDVDGVAPRLLAPAGGVGKNVSLEVPGDGFAVVLVPPIDGDSCEIVGFAWVGTSGRALVVGGVDGRTRTRSPSGMPACACSPSGRGPNITNSVAVASAAR